MRVAGRVSEGLERLLGLDVRYYVRGGAVLFATQAFLIMLSFMLSVVFARVATKELFGRFQFVLAVVGMVSILALPGLNAAVQLGAARGQDGVLAQGARYKRWFSVLGVAALGVAAGYFYRIGNDAVWKACAVSLFAFPLVYSFDVVHAFFAGKRRFDLTCAFQLVSEGLSSVVAMVLLFVTGELWLILLGYWALKAVGVTLGYVFARARFRGVETDTDLLKYGAHLTVMNVFPYVKAFFDKLVVAYFLGFAATAVYGIGQAVSEQLYAVSKNVANVVFPKVAERERDLAFGVVRKKLWLLVLFFSVIAAFAVLLAPLVIPFFFSEQYAGTVWIAQVLVVASVPRAIGMVLSRAQEAQKEKGRLYRINIVYSLIEIVGLLMLAPLYGLAGIVAAKAVANVVYAGVAFWAVSV